MKNENWSKAKMGGAVITDTQAGEELFLRLRREA